MPSTPATPSTRELLDHRPETRERMRLLTAPVEHEIVILKSRFIAYLAPVSIVEEADRVIRERRAMHPNARHHCTALTLGTPVSLQRSNDDGEPGGTAGVPMAQALRGRHMTNIVGVVTRYFGGTKLGAGGLTRAYGSAVTEALNVAEGKGTVCERVLRELSRLRVGYELAGTFEAGMRAWAHSMPAYTVDDAHYGAEGLTLSVTHEPGGSAELAVAAAELSSGQVTPSTAGWAYVNVPAR